MGSHKVHSDEKAKTKSGKRCLMLRALMYICMYVYVCVCAHKHRNSHKFKVNSGFPPPPRLFIWLTVRTCVKIFDVSRAYAHNKATKTICVGCVAWLSFETAAGLLT